MTLLLQLLPDVPGKVQSCVVRFFSYRSFFSLIDHCVATPSGVIQACGMCLMLSMVMGMAHWEATSLSNDFVRASLFSFVFADWWLPRCSMKSMSASHSSAVMGSSG